MTAKFDQVITSDLGTPNALACFSARRGGDGDPLIVLTFTDAKGQPVGNLVLICEPDYVRRLALHMMEVADRAEDGQIDCLPE